MASRSEAETEFSDSSLSCVVRLGHRAPRQSESVNEPARRVVRQSKAALLQARAFEISGDLEIGLPAHFCVFFFEVDAGEANRNILSPN